MADFDTPSLFGATGPGSSGRDPSPLVLASGTSPQALSLLDLLYDGFYMIFMLRSRSLPVDAESFRDRVRDFVADFERESERLKVSADDAYLAKFAYCALVDEVVLMSQPTLRANWEVRPLQLEIFGEQLAGERFFEHLEKLRETGATKVALLEVFHMCLLMGFQGKYIVEGSEKLNYVTGRVGDEIAQHRGKRLGFAPRWAAPDRVSHALRNEVPLWVIGAVFALLGLLGFLGVRADLQRHTEEDLGVYGQVVRLSPQSAYIILTLP